MNKIVLIQHCQSQHHLDDQKRFPDSGNGLTALGKRQARMVAERLSEWCATCSVSLYSSDMTRARETAEVLGQRLHIEPQLHAELREWSDPLALARRSKPTSSSSQDGQSLLDWRPYDEHETWREFYARVSGFMARLSQDDFEGAAPVVVTHGGTLSNIVVWWLQIPLDVLRERTCFAATPGSISVLKRNRYGTPVIETLNDRAHLAEIDEQDVAPNHGRAERGRESISDNNHRLTNGCG